MNTYEKEINDIIVKLQSAIKNLKVVKDFEYCTTFKILVENAKINIEQSLEEIISMSRDDLI
jgi:hypothetical protein